MNETLQVIENRKSVRAFSPDPISAEEKQTILHASMRAPTAGNLMLYSIIEIENQAIKDQLAVSCDDQPFIAKAPWALLFVADYQRLMDFYDFCAVESACKEKGMEGRSPAEGDLFLACCDALIAAQTAVIAAESLGIGSCYIGDIIEQEEFHRALFHLPRYTLPITLLVFGRPSNRTSSRNLSLRYDDEFVVFPNQYRRLTGSDFERLFAKKSSNLPDQSVKDVGKNLYFRKFATDFSVEMTRSAQKWISAWVHNNEFNK